MLVESLLGFGVAVLVFNLALTWATRQRVDAVAVGLTESVRILETAIDRFDEVLDSPDPNVEAIRTEIVDALEGVFSNMKVPDARDHVAGAIAQFIQMLTLKKFGGPEQIAALLGGQMADIPPEAPEIGN